MHILLNFAPRRCWVVSLQAHCVLLTLLKNTYPGFSGSNRANERNCGAPTCYTLFISSLLPSLLTFTTSISFSISFPLILCYFHKFSIFSCLISPFYSRTLVTETWLTRTPWYLEKDPISFNPFFVPFGVRGSGVLLHFLAISSLFWHEMNN